MVDAHKLPDQIKSVYFEGLSKSLSIYLDTNENVILLADFNLTQENKNIQLFADFFNLDNLIKNSVLA